ncbi:hypothetical protein [Clostridium sp. CCUG 7971]|uniref:hypothetical protein n=1 Tax=Clostridium sp. CCUG 7971 TaxID=2811414 RepID=UPI001ABA2844|nr:hypothetical protein [Clostridium sp. CCUG 7971]MBO3446399.1 hypothetical protein [Clostridium sp. CCUG 7971]
MSNILTLYNMEFKRIYKLYFGLIVTLFLGNIVSVGLGINDTMRHMNRNQMIPLDFNIFKTYINEDYVKGFVIDQIHVFSSIVLGIAVLSCLIYALIIWYRDYYSRSKTICALLTLPQKRFNIYLAKLLTILVMIYGIIVSQVIFWYIDTIILKIITGANIDGFTNIFSNMMNNPSRLNLISPYIIDFFMINIFGVLLSVVVIFTGVLIERSYKRKGIAFGILYILLSLIIYYFMLIKYVTYSDQGLSMSLIYFLILFILSISISYKLIKSKITL